LVVRSPVHAAHQAVGLEKRLVHAAQKLAALTPARGRGKRQLTDEVTLVEAIARVLQEQRVEGLLTVAWERQVAQQTHDVGRGRGAPGGGRMPVEFLTEDQQRRYGCYTEEPSPLQLDRYFHLDDRDQQLIAQRQTAHTRLGFAVQLGTVRFLGTLLPDPTDVPASVVTYVATQLGTRDTTCLTQYHTRDTHWDHATQIRRVYGYHEFHEPREVFRLVRWLYTRAWLSAERPSVLFDLATAQLVARKVLLPGVTTLERLVARVRDRTAERLWRLLAQVPNTEQQARSIRSSTCRKARGPASWTSCGVPPSA
jgi:hypothetical protein